MSPDSAAAIRASLERPPATPPFDAVDAIALPFRIVFFPIRVIGKANAKLVGQLAKLAKPREATLFERLADEGLRPAFGGLGPRSGFAAGLRIDRWRPLVLETGFSIRGSQRHLIGFDFDSPLYRFQPTYMFQRDAEPHFWGIGPDTEKNDVRDYQLDRQVATAIGTLRLRGLNLIAGAGYQDNRVSRGSDEDTGDLPDLPDDERPYGVDERTKYFVFSASGVFDRTFMVSHQRRGVFLEVGSSLFLGVDGTESDFHRINLTVHSYAPINPRQSLALRGLAELNRGRGEGIPFFHLARLGDEAGSRAYKRDRFRDRDMAAIMSEWRYEVWRELHNRGRVESFLFLDTGAVDHKLTQISFSQLRWSYGFGFRVIWSNQVRWLAYLGFGDDGARIDVTFSWVY
ncbi:MAG: BamA/TamA family outer membrane protein [Gemmatimonadota bacterium]|nr:MAG: BamA/TamA family outer membrane protein [Gemmatimonadota bacterium]